MSIESTKDQETATADPHAARRGDSLNYARRKLSRIVWRTTFCIFHRNVYTV